MPPVQKLLIVGGNGFVGSSIAKAAVKKGWQVTSLSRSGSRFKTPAGHEPSWVREVEWRAGTPFNPATYASLLPSCTAVVSTLGILLESNYKDKGQANPLGVLQGVVDNVLGARGNPLGKYSTERSYERLNRDAAVTLAQTFFNSNPTLSSSRRSPFVYISAEDIFRPFIPSRYISTKRQAESIISSLSRGPSLTTFEANAELISRNSSRIKHRSIRPVFIRPSLIYHPHLAPATTLPATFLEMTSKVHQLIPEPLRLNTLLAGSAGGAISSDTALGAQGEELPSALSSLASLLAIPPIHVDAVGQAVIRSIEDEQVEGVINVQRMRDLLDFDR